MEKDEDMEERINYKMLTLARESRGLTQGQLCDLISNLNQGNLSKMEKGLLSITDEILKNIAKSLNYPESFFKIKESIAPIDNIYYRKRVSITKKELSVLETKLTIIMLAVDKLVDSVDLPEFLIENTKVTKENDPKNIARQIRSHLRIERGPIDELCRIIEKAGVIIIFLNLNSEKFDGVSLFSNKNIPLMFINKNRSNDRVRFTIAHEFGHIIMHLRNQFNDNQAEADNEANEFASEFLMPYLDIRNDLQRLDYKKLSLLKQYWKVSKSSLIYKAKSEGIILPNIATSLMVRLSQEGERKEENGYVPLSEPTVFKDLINVHFTHLGYTETDFNNLVNVYYDDFKQYIEENKIIRFRPQIVI